MAFQAVAVELIGRVIRIRCLVEILLMTSPAVLGRSGVAVVRVASDAGRGPVRSGQWKCRCGVVESRRNPRGL